jgi:hypothetical protein
MSARRFDSSPVGSQLGWHAPESATGVAMDHRPRPSQSVRRCPPNWPATCPHFRTALRNTLLTISDFQHPIFAAGADCRIVFQRGVYARKRGVFRGRKTVAGALPEHQSGTKSARNGAKSSYQEPFLRFGSRNQTGERIAQHAVAQP